MNLLLFFLSLTILSGCSSNVVFDQKKEVHELFKGIEFIPADYIIGPSDGLEVSYYIDPRFKIDNYIIDTEDKLNINFEYYPELNKSIKVRPDGFIFLYKIGEVKAAGEKPYDLAAKISELYSKQLTKPEVTIDVVEFNSKIIDFLKDAVRTPDRGQVRYVVVSPDGKISLPYLRDNLIAAGKTPLDLSREIEKAYRKNVNNISIAVSVLEAKSYQACVLGDVSDPGCYSLSSSNTLLQIISRAGGFKKEANLRQVMIISRGENKKPKHRIVNIKELINSSHSDTIINQYDVVYVPRAWLSEVAITLEAIWQIIPINFSATVYER